jgi:hypothetical protein
MSSSVENTPPKSIEALERNQAKVLKHADSLALKTQRVLKKLFEYQQRVFEDLSMTKETITRLRIFQEPLRRQYTKRQAKPLSQTGVLKPKDANRSIAIRKAKENAALERRIFKACKTRRRPLCVSKAIELIEIESKSLSALIL